MPLDIDLLGQLADDTLPAQRRCEVGADQRCRVLHGEVPARFGIHAADCDDLRGDRGGGASSGCASPTGRRSGRRPPSPRSATGSWSCRTTRRTGRGSARGAVERRTTAPGGRRARACSTRRPGPSTSSPTSKRRARSRSTGLRRCCCWVGVAGRADAVVDSCGSSTARPGRHGRRYGAALCRGRQLRCRSPPDALNLEGACAGRRGAAVVPPRAPDRGRVRGKRRPGPGAAQSLPCSGGSGPDPSR